MSSTYEYLSAVFDSVNRDPQNMLLLTLTYLANVAPKENADRSITLARLMDTLVKVELAGRDPSWLTKILNREIDVTVDTKKWENSQVSITRNRPTVPMAPAIAPLGQKMVNKNRSIRKQGARKLVPSKKTTESVVEADESVERSTKIIPSKTAGNSLLNAKVPDTLAEAQMTISKAMTRNEIVAAVIECCRKLFDKPDFVGVYFRKPKCFESRLPHEKKPTRISFAEAGIMNQAAKLKKPLCLSAAEASNSKYYNASVDSYKEKQCNLLYIPVFVPLSGNSAVIKICRQNTEFDADERRVAHYIGMQVAIALENVNIATGFLSLANLADDLDQIVNIGEAMSKVTNAAKSILHCQSAMIFLSENRTTPGQSHLIYSYNNGNQHLKLAIDHNTVVGSCFIDKRAVNIENMHYDKRQNKYIEHLQGCESQSVMCVPIMGSKNTLMGVIRVANKINGKKFSRRDITVLQGLSTTTSMVIHNGIVNESSLMAQRKAQSLLKISKLLNEENNLVDLIQCIQKEARLLMHCDRVSLFLHDAISNELYTVAIGEDGAPFEIRFDCNMGLAGACFTSGKVINIMDAWEDARFNSQFDVATGYRTKSALIVVIHNHLGKKIGVIQCLNKITSGDIESFTTLDVHLADSFGAIVAIAIENLRNAERLVELQKYFSMHEANAYDIYFELDADQKVIDVSRDEQSRELFPLEPEKIIGRNWGEFIGPTNSTLSEIIKDCQKYPHGVMLKEAVFRVPGGQTLLLDANIVPCTFCEEIGHKNREKGFEKHYEHLGVKSHTYLGDNKAICTYIVYCSNMKVKRSASVLIEKSPMFFEDTKPEKEAVPLLAITFDVPIDLRQKVIVGIMNEVHIGKGTVHSIENNTLRALFGTPHSSTSDIANICKVAEKVDKFMLMSEDAYALEQDILEGEEEKDIFSYQTALISAKMQVWNRWTSTCTYKIFPESLEKSRWLTEHGFYFGAKILVEGDVAMHLPRSVLTRKIASAVWAGDHSDIQAEAFYHLTPFETQRAMMVDLVRKGKCNIPALACDLFEILDKDNVGKKDGWIRKFQKGLVAFQSQDWSRALKLFNAVLLEKSDICSRKYKEVCSQFLASGVRFNGRWKGTWQVGCEKFILKYFGSELDRSIWSTQHLPIEDILPRDIPPPHPLDSRANSQRNLDAAEMRSMNGQVVSCRKCSCEVHESGKSGQQNSKEVVVVNEVPANSISSKAEETDIASIHDEEENTSEVPIIQILSAEKKKTILKKKKTEAEIYSMKSYFYRQWNRFDVDKDGALNVREIQGMLQYFVDVKITPDIAKSFLNTIVGDCSSKNPSVAKEDLVQFIHDGQSMTSSEKDAFLSERGALQKLVIEFVNGVDSRRKGTLEGFMARMWVKHDVDIDGALNIDETRSALSDFIGIQSNFTDRQLKHIFQHADTNKDGLIQLEELQAMIEDVDKMNTEARVSFQRTNPLNGFVLQVCDAIQKRREEEEVDVTFQRFFGQVDTDKSGTLSKRELMKALNDPSFMVPMIVNHEILQPLFNGKTFLKTFERMNATETGEITNEEFMTFVRTMPTSQADIALQEFFDAVDTDNSGTITKKELLKALRKPALFHSAAAKNERLRPLLNGKTYLKTFKDMDIGNKGEFTYEELRQFVNEKI